MALEYAKVLKRMAARFLVVGRGDDSARRLEDDLGCAVIRGGLGAFLRHRHSAPAKAAIVAVDADQAFEVMSDLIDHGVGRLLVEKPGAVSRTQLRELEGARARHGVEAFVGYNRRFYGSVARAMDIIADDRGATSIHFDFTEWVDEVPSLPLSDRVKRFWVITNSSHVIDLAFFLAGRPREIATFHEGQLDWHQSSSIFSGAGTTETGALFSYDANWGAPGRWSVEVVTRNHRLLFRPLEILQLQEKGTLTWEPVAVDRSWDEQHKPGLYRQTEAFLQNDLRHLKTLYQQVHDFDLWYRIAGYDDRNE